MQEIKGLVIKEVKVSEDSKIITVLTSEYGKLQFWTKGSRNYKSKNFSGTRILCYSLFETVSNTNQNSNLIKIKGSECIKHFNNISSDMLKTAISCWFMQLVDILVPNNHPTNDILRLLLNSLYYIDSKINGDDDIKKILLVKLIFELRLLSNLGMAPNLKSCVQCGSSNFIVNVSHEIGGVVCFNCNTNNIDHFSSNFNSSIRLMKHAIECDLKQLFSIQVNYSILESVVLFAEKFMFSYLDMIPKSYKFLKDEISRVKNNTMMVV